MSNPTSRSTNPDARSSVWGLFTDHPASVDESYVQHAGFALRFSGWLALAACAAFVHAVFPFLFKSTAGQIVIRLQTKLSSRH